MAGARLPPPTLTSLWGAAPLQSPWKTSVHSWPTHSWKVPTAPPEKVRILTCTQLLTTERPRGSNENEGEHLVSGERRNSRVRTAERPDWPNAGGEQDRLRAARGQPDVFRSPWLREVWAPAGALLGAESTLGSQHPLHAMPRMPPASAVYTG